MRKLMENLKITGIIVGVLIIISISSTFATCAFWEYNAYNFINFKNDNYSADITIGNSTRHIDSIKELYETRTKYRIVDNYGNEYTADKNCVLLIRESDE